MEKELRKEQEVCTQFSFGAKYLSEIVEKFKNGYAPKSRNKKDKRNKNIIRCTTGEFEQLELDLDNKGDIDGN